MAAGGTLIRRYALALTPTGAAVEAAVTAASVPPLSGGPDSHGSAAAHAFTIADSVGGTGSQPAEGRLEVAEISGGRVRLRAGTLYTALDRLRGDGLIAVEREEIVDGRLRRYYLLTDDGAAALRAEAARLQANASAALTRLRLAGGLAGGTA